MSEARKRPCSICRRWFRPDPRIGSRQHACRSPECQKFRRKKKQKAWRERHPDYFNARRILDRSKQERIPEPLRVGAPLNQLPWDIAQSQFGVQGADFIGIFGRVLLEAAQSQFTAYIVEDEGVRDTLPVPAAQSQMRAVRESVRIGTEGREAGISSTGPPV